LDRINQIIAEILDVPAESIDLNSGPHNLIQWDSATHLGIVLSLQTEYGVTLSIDEIAGVMSVAAIKECLARKGVILQ
jgi:acyl carrier protein